MKFKWVSALTTILIYSCNMHYTEFKTVELQNDQFVVSRHTGSPEFRENIIQVFEFYKVDYKVTDSKLLIATKLWEDKDLMWNYTSKAKNQDWLNNHPIEK